MDRQALLTLLGAKTDTEALDLIASRVFGMLHIPDPGELMRYSCFSDEIENGRALVIKNGTSWSWVGAIDAPAYLTPWCYIEVCDLLRWTGETLKGVGSHLYKRVPLESQQ